MNARLEKLVVSLLLVIFFVALANTFVSQGFSLTKEEAIEISRNSETVQHYMEESDHYSLEVHYLNSTQVDMAREEFPALQEMYPENRSIWTVTWYIHPRPPSGAILFITDVIDDETGQIFHEGAGRYG